MKHSEFNFQEYVSTDEHNLHENFEKLKSCFDIFLRLDDLYKQPLDSSFVNETDAVIPSLYLMVHSKLYFSMACLLRGHISEGLGATRGAIDAGLTAYKLILEPETKESYLKREWSFQNIKSTLSKARQKDGNAYPLAEVLMELHEMCSACVSHADISTIKHRIEMHKQETSVASLLSFKYHEGPSDGALYHGILIDFLNTYQRLLVIFHSFVAETCSINYGEWVGKLNDIFLLLNEERQKSQQHIDSINDKQLANK